MKFLLGAVALVLVGLRGGLALSLTSSLHARLQASSGVRFWRGQERRWCRLRASENDDERSGDGSVGDGSAAEEDEELDAAFQARVAELGGTTGVRARVAASQLRRDVRDAVAEKGRSLKKALDLDPKGGSFAKGSAMEELQRVELGGWASTVGLLALVVLLAVAQSFRLDPSNYT